MKCPSVISVFCLHLLLAGPAMPSDTKPNPQPRPKHVKAGISCYNCHQEENITSGAGVTDGSCMACHGDLPELAVVTKGAPVNPHAQRPAPHPATPACKECHRQHQAPVVKCLDCHPKFTFTVK